MDFLKKHYDKVLLAVTLLLLIVAVVYLSFRLSELGQEGGTIQTKGAPVPALDITVYTNAIASLENPPRWSLAAPDLFGQPPGPPVDGGPGTNLPPETPQVYLLRVAREPFKLLFKAYTGNGSNIQINFRDFTKTFFVPAVGDFVQDRFENTGYKITKFERKTTNVVTNVGMVEQDVSELTLKHEGEEPILLKLRQETEQKEPVASIRCGTSTQSRKMARGQRFNCGGKTYIVVDMNQTQMIIVEAESGKKHTIGVTGSR
jgi:sorbitol-specific phosphotransferase system component IIA